MEQYILKQAAKIKFGISPLSFHQGEEIAVKAIVCGELGMK
jgi:hypothetical protein